MIWVLMRIRNIASGSSGNVTYVGGGNTHILIDAGISKKRICQGLNEIGLDIRDINGIFITHEHIDHISALGVISRYAGIPIYATEGTIKGIKRMRCLGDFDTGLLVPVEADRDVQVGDLNIIPYSISHDANQPVCYKVVHGEKTFASVTDLGVYDEGLVERLQGLDAILLEANHDVRMLEAGPYPYPLKRRILGSMGHLSNETSGQFLSRLLNEKMQYILLGHLSRENNERSLAKLAVQTEIKQSPVRFGPEDFEINVAHREQPSDPVEL